MKIHNMIMTLVFLAFGATFLVAGELEALLPVLASEEADVTTNAQLQWMKICFDADGDDAQRADVNREMCDQLKKDLPKRTRMFLLHVMQWTGDQDVVATLDVLLDDPDQHIREGALRALTKNPSQDALKTLENRLKKATDKKMLEDAIASRTVKMDVGVESVSPMNLPYENDKAVAAWMQGYEKLSDVEKAQTIAALTVRKDAKYKPFVMEAIQSDDAILKQTGVLALAALGTADDIPLMLKLASEYDQNLLTDIMSVVVDEPFDAKLLETLQSEKNPDQFRLIADIAARRNMADAFPIILVAAKVEDCPNRSALLGPLEQLADRSGIASIADVVLLIQDRRDRDDAERVIVRLCKGDPNGVIEKLTDENRPELLPMLGRVGGDKTLEIVLRELKSSQAVHRDAAFRALCNWPNAVVAEELLGIAENEQYPNSAKIAALRAFARVISLPGNQIGISISAKEKLDMLTKAMSLAGRNEEKQLIIDRAAAVRLPETVTFVLQYVEDKDLNQNVCRTIVELAHHDALRRENKEIFGAALEKVLEICQDNGLKDRAQRYLDNM